MRKRVVLLVAGVATSLLLLSGCSGPSEPSPDAKEADVVTFAATGGAVGALFQEAAKKFESETGIHIDFVEGATNEIYAKVVAEKANPVIDVLVTSPSTTAQGEAAGLFAPVDESSVPNIKDLYKATPSDGFNVPIQIAAEGFAYNKDLLSKNGIDPIKSLDDLYNPALKGRVSLNGPEGNFGIHELMMFAQANGGDIDNVEPGFTAMKRLRDIGNWTMTPASTGEADNLMSQGSAWVAYTSGIHVGTLASQGVPMVFVAPEPTGGFINLTGVAIVTGTDVPKNAAKWINYLLSPDIQLLQAKEAFIGPSNKTVKLPDDIAANVPYGEDEVSALQRPDDVKVGKLAPGWVDQWNQKLGG